MHAKPVKQNSDVELNSTVLYFKYAHANTCKNVVAYISYFPHAVVVYFNLSRLLYLAFSANLGLLCMPHPGMGPLV